MAQSRAYSSKDTFISETSLTANNGANPVLEVYNKYTPLTGKKEWARILIQFPLEDLKEKIENKTIGDPREDNTASAFINMKNVMHGEEIATDFDIWALPLTASWVEGRGLDSDDYLYEDAANSLYATNTTLWADYAGGASGGNVILGAHNKEWDSNSASQYFEHGEENLKIDITEYFKEYLNGASANYGFMIRMSDAQESKTIQDTIDAGVIQSYMTTSWNTKKFYSRETNTSNAPYFSVEWDNSIRDDRNILQFSNNGSLFYYNFQNGNLVDLDGTGKFPGHVTLSADGVSISPTNLTASRVAVGTYKINIGTAQNDLEDSLTGINIALSATENFVDNWTITSDQEALNLSKTFNFNVSLPTVDAQRYYEISKYPIRLPNLQNSYEKGTKSFIKVFIRDASTRLQSVTGMSNSLNTHTCTNGKFEIREKITDLVEVSQDNLSYDENGNYFLLDTENLYRGMEYKLVFTLNINGQTFVYDEPEIWSFYIK